MAGLNLNPIKMTGAARVHLGAVAYDTNPFTRITLNTSATHLSQTGSADTLVDGQRLFITDGTKVATLELDLNDSVLPGSAAVNVSAGSTPHQIASEIIFEINRAALGLSPRHLGNGLIHVGGTVLHDLDTASVPAITKLGPGGAVPDGQAFFVTEGAVTKRFEYDKDGVMTPGSIRISITDAMSRDEIALATVSAMSPGTSSLGIVPTYLGNGLIDVGGNDESDVLTLSTSLEIDPAFPPLQFRVPGPGGGAGGVIDQETFTITTTWSRPQPQTTCSSSTTTASSFPVTCGSVSSHGHPERRGAAHRHGGREQRAGVGAGQPGRRRRESGRRSLGF